MNARDTIISQYKVLVETHKTADISVSDICRAAGLSRKTFYNYFEDRFDLLKCIMIDEIEAPLRKALKMQLTGYETARMLFANLLLDKSFYEIAIMENNQNSLFHNMIDSLTNIISSNSKKSELSVQENEYVTYKAATSLVMVIRKWMAEGMKESPDLMSKILFYVRPQ